MASAAGNSRRFFTTTGPVKPDRHYCIPPLDRLDLAWYVDVDGGPDVRKLLSAFQMFFREHSEHWSERFQYREAWPQLLL